MRLHQVAISVQDIEKAVAFYRDRLGLSLIHQFTQGPALAFFDLGGPRLMIEQSEQSNPATFYLWVSDLAGKIDELELVDVEIVQRPTVIFEDKNGIFGTPEQSEYLAFVRDPSGNLIGLMSRS